MEEFFKDPRLRELFLFFSDEIKAKGSTISENRCSMGSIAKEKHDEINI